MSSIVAGFALLAVHDMAAGGAGAAPRYWPAGSRIPRSDQLHTLVMFAHPRCPCFRASLAELEKLLARRANTVVPWVVFFEPAGADDDWQHSDQRSTAANIPGVQLLRDVDGQEARRFHAQTSGHTVLYSANGELQFSGGVTAARGHSGDNAGRIAIEMILSALSPESREAPVFGCPIGVLSENR
jgi:hypothetical protein